ncbi:MAG: kelch repeat-containing protein, partial [Planctomycetota bacterium]
MMLLRWFFALSVCLTTALPGQVTWARANALGWQTHPVMVYDAARQQLLLLTSRRYFETWAWSGSEWTLLSPFNNPPPLSGFGAVFDAARQRVVLFGGDASATSFFDTWEWDGRTWRALPVTQPQPPRPLNGALAYDEARQCVVAFSGRGTWEWDGISWRQRPTAIAPVRRSGHVMGYDPVRQRVILFGGGGPPGAVFDDTWEWDGTNWTERVPTQRPPARMATAAAWDTTRQRWLLFGGDSSFTTLSELGDTWEWDGNDWRPRAPSTAPTPRSRHGMAYDAQRDRTVLYGGGISAQARTWQWDGADWTGAPQTAPPGRADVAMTYDSRRDRVVLYRETQPTDTWEWDGRRWWQGADLGLPFSCNQQVGLTYDEAQGVSVLLATYCQQQWHWDGSLWSAVTPPLLPPSRSESDIAYDAKRQRVVLFGGNGGLGGLLDDTWEWDGTRWTLLLPLRSPSPRADFALGYDADRQCVVLFGGRDATGRRNDTWEYDGAGWVERSSATSPPALEDAGLAYDAARQRMVLTGGAAGDNQAWEWDGSAWRQRRSLPVQPYSYQHELAFQASTQRMLVMVNVGSETETYEYYGTSEATYDLFGTGCTGASGVPTLSVYPSQRPVLGTTFTVQVFNLVPGNPALMSFGGSASSWAGVALPLDLTMAGLLGCRLYVSPDLLVPLSNLGGFASQPIIVPRVTALLGATFFNQAWAPRPPRAPPPRGRRWRAPRARRAEPGKTTPQTTQH